MVLDKMTKAIGQNVCVSGQERTKLLETDDSNNTWQLNTRDALVEGVPVVAIVIGKSKSFKEQMMQLLRRLYADYINL